MANENSNQLDKFFDELKQIIKDPIHKKILAAYSNKPNPLEAMEEELGNYLIGVIKDEVEED